MRAMTVSWGVLALLAVGCGEPKKDGNGNKAKEAKAARLKAHEAIDKEDWEGAVKELDKAIELEPDDVDAWWMRGLAHFCMKNNDKAIADCTEAIKRDKNYASAYRERGRAHYSKESYKLAIEDYTKYIELRPNDAEVYGFRAIAYNKIGDVEKTDADLKKADELEKKK